MKNQISAEDKRQILALVRSMVNDIACLSLICSEYSEDAVNEIIAEKYPFAFSLDEMVWEMWSWHDLIHDKLEEVKA